MSNNLKETKHYTSDKFGNSIPPKPLLACPFCGAPALFQVGLIYYVACCSDPKCKATIIDTGDDRVCRKWNKRTPL